VGDPLLLARHELALFEEKEQEEEEEEEEEEEVEEEDEDNDREHLQKHQNWPSLLLVGSLKPLLLCC
jgi:hypothetical protein